ncbi:MAG: hypothetical protein AAF621_04960 [Pseudomonadota bacterium]
MHLAKDINPEDVKEKIRRKMHQVQDQKIIIPAMFDDLLGKVKENLANLNLKEKIKGALGKVLAVGNPFLENMLPKQRKKQVLQAISKAIKTAENNSSDLI